MLHALTNKRSKFTLLGLVSILFIFYVVFTCYLLFFGYSRQSEPIYGYNIVPLYTIKLYINARSYIDFSIWFSNLFGNVVVFAPLGFLLPLLFQRFNNPFKIFLFSFFASLCVELIQLTFHVGGFDVDDILLNTIGGEVGYILLHIVLKLIFTSNPLIKK